MTFAGYNAYDIILFRVLNMITDPSANNQTYEAQAQLLKLLTHPARLAILNILRDGEHCVCHMEAYLGYRQAYISQQLMVLREAGLIQDRRDGWNVFYRVIDARIFEVLGAVERMLGLEPGPGAQKPATACACPHCNAAEEQ